MRNRLSDEELFHFCEQFSIILKSGIPAVEGLRVLWEDSSEKEEKDFLEELLKVMEEEGDLSITLQKSGAFPEYMISYVHLGEQTGSLDEVMEILSHYYEQEIDLKSQVRSAVTYPLIMLGMMLAVLTILLIKVLPVFSQVLKQIGMEMSGISGGLLRLGQTIQRYSVVFVVLLVVIAGLALYFCFHENGRKQMLKLILKMPRFAAIPASRDYSRLTQGISLGLHSGLTPEDSIEMSKSLVSVPKIGEQLHDTAEKLRDGERFSDALKDSGLFGGMEARLISVGMESGLGDEVMHRLSQRYAENSAVLVNRAVNILEPTIVIIMTVLVGLVLLSVMLPLLGVLTEMM